MELIEYIRHLYRFKMWLLAGIIIGGLVGAVFANSAKDQYQASTSLLIQRKADQPNSQYFTYEGFYAQQTAASYADTVIKLLVTDEIIAEAARLAGYEKTPQQISALKSFIVVKKDAPQLISVRITQPTYDLANKLAAGLSQSIKQRTVDLNQYGDSSLSIEQVESEPLVRLARPSVLIYSAAGALVGLVLAIMASAVWAFIRAQRRHRAAKA